MQVGCNHFLLIFFVTDCFYLDWGEFWICIALLYKKKKKKSKSMTKAVFYWLLSLFLIHNDGYSFYKIGWQMKKYNATDKSGLK